MTAMGFLVASAVLSGCSPFRLFGLRNFSEISRQNNTRIMTLQPGMTPSGPYFSIPGWRWGMSPVSSTVI